MLIYLASPYSKYPNGKVEAFTQACLKAGVLMLEGYEVFCPIAHSHSIEEYMDEVHDGDFWLKQDFAVLQHCDELWVYKMPGWGVSEGVAREVMFARDHSIPVKYIEYDPVTVD